LFRLHSWAPVFIDLNNVSVESQELYPGISLWTQNLLSTCFGSLAYGYHQGNHYLQAGVSYQKWWPIIDINYTYGGEPVVYKASSTAEPLTGPADDQRLSASVRLPFNLSRGRNLNQIQLSSGIEWRNAMYFDYLANNYEQNLAIFKYQLQAQHSVQRAHRDIYPRWGQSFQALLYHAPLDNQAFGIFTNLQLAIFVPGILSHQGLKLKGMAQWQQPEQYYLPYNSIMPRGFENQLAQEALSWSADYIMPLAYPDVNIWRLLYIKRVYATLFYDFCNFRVRSNDEKSLIWSEGFELMFDFHAGHISFPFGAGCRLGNKNENGQNSFFGEFLFGYKF
jgi:hypothetical protein